MHNHLRQTHKLDNQSEVYKQYLRQAQIAVLKIWRKIHQIQTAEVSKLIVITIAEMTAKKLVRMRELLAKMYWKIP